MSRYLGTSQLAGAFELIFVNDGSKNASQQQLAAVAERFSFVKVIELSRNFGQHVAISCGYRYSTGEFVGMMNGDQQDPPDQIPLLLEALKSGNCDIAIGLRTRRADTFMHTVTSKGFNLVLNWLTGSKMPLNSATLRIMTRQFVDAYNSLQERTPFIPGLENWLGFRHAYVPIRHQPRTLGKSSYTFRKRWKMAMDSIVGFSDLPIRVAALLGFVITLIGMLLAAVLVIQKLTVSDILPGYTSTTSAVLVLGGLNLTFLGLTSLYVGRILREVQGRPRYIVKSFVSFSFENEAIHPPNASQQIPDT